MKIQVTQEDIDKGKKQHCGECPVALAIQRIFQNGYVNVGYNDIIIGRDFYRIPDIAHNNIVDFDAGKSISPFEFELEKLR